MTPQLATAAVEAAFGLSLDGTVNPYPSYVNRVYGMRTDDGREVVAKFYRPGRWSFEAVAEEHAFLSELSAAEIPVAAPIAGPDGETLAEVEAGGGSDGSNVGGTDGGEGGLLFALFPKRGGRNFDPETAEDWLRVGSLLGRVHAVGARATAVSRLDCRPDTLTAAYVEEILEAGLVHPEFRTEFEDLAGETIASAAPAFEGFAMQRVHGDFHRGNVLDRPGEGLLVIDFDDMMTAPPVQDLWLLLPGSADDCARELALILEGYESFHHFDRSSFRLIEPLRFMRIIYFLAWRARQRFDHWFRRDFPDWGGRAFWIKEIEDLREQAARVALD